MTRRERAGWRGLLLALGMVMVWLGPAISKAQFEVGPEVFEAFVAFCDGQDWAALERRSGLTRTALEAAAGVYARAKAVIGIYGMGLTQHRKGTETVRISPVPPPAPEEVRVGAVLRQLEPEVEARRRDLGGVERLVTARRDGPRRHRRLPEPEPGEDDAGGEL